MGDLRKHSMPHVLDAELSTSERSLRDAALAESHGVRRAYHEPNHPNAIEQHYLDAIMLFRARRPTRAYDHLERGDYRTALRFGRKKHRARGRHRTRGTRS